MIPQKQLEEIRSYLKKSENPLFFFDDDCDGLCSYLLLKRYIKNGKGIILKTSPNLDMSFVKKVQENMPDLVVILDQPIIAQEFIDNVHVPIVWIDHHPIVKRNGIHYYNPLQLDKDDNRPVSYWCYQITKQDQWLAVIGSVADWHIPEFIEDFIKDYPELLERKETPEKTLFETNLGQLIKIFSFLLKGKISEVYSSIAIINKLESPLEVIQQTTPRGKFLYKHFERMNKPYTALLNKALKTKAKDSLFLFIYPSSTMSFTKELANELIYHMQDKIVMVGREKDDAIRFSIRSMTIKIDEIIKRALRNVEGYGGGHHLACGANIAKKDFNTFIKNTKHEIKKEMNS